MLSRARGMDIYRIEREHVKRINERSEVGMSREFNQHKIIVAALCAPSFDFRRVCEWTLVQS
jgi:hypothetical protein